jgi:hypothetical protein
MPQIRILLKNNINEEYFNNSLICNYAYFYKKNNIDIHDEYIKSDLTDNNHNSNTIQKQIGGDTFIKKIKDISYTFDYYKSKSEDNFNNAIIIKRDSTTEQSNNDEYSQTKHCALLLYNNKEILKLAFLNMHSDCYKSIGKDKSGSILLKLIINFAREQGFKKIILSDQSLFNCKDNEYGVRYEIKYLHTLTHGYSWYSKYGFKFIGKEEQEIFIHNKTILDKIKTKDYPLDILIRIIMRKIVDSKIHSIMSNYNYLDSINNIINIYDQLAEKQFYEFMKIITKNYCFIVSFIYKQIYDSLNLKEYPTSEMELIL